MDIDVLREKRSKLESQIAGSVSKSVETFKSETGFSPDSINIDMMECSVIGDKEAQFIVGGCKVNVRM